jgi:hypothetical protein
MDEIPWDPLTRPAPADDSAGSGTPSPQGRGQFIDIGRD